MTRVIQSQKFHPLENGTVLVISMVFLLLLTIVGLAGMRSSIMNERMSGNMRDVNIALNAAETALRDGEEWLDAQKHPVPVVDWDGCATPPCPVFRADDTKPINPLTAEQWTGSAGLFIEYGSPGTDDLTEAESDPRRVIEYVRFEPGSLDLGHAQSPGMDVYRITARGTGKTATAEAVVQSTFFKTR